MGAGTLSGVYERYADHAPYLKAFEDKSSSELSDMERAVTDTMNTPGWGHIERLWSIREHDLIENVLRLHPADSHMEYAAASAKVAGLREARTAPRALAKVAEQRRQEADRNG